jgi:hypothetical protein
MQSYFCQSYERFVAVNDIVGYKENEKDVILLKFRQIQVISHSNRPMAGFTLLQISLDLVDCIGG